MKEMWDSRYGEEGFAYGKQPNEYFQAQIDKLNKGKILLPAEGEGRNAVYAASLGWEVSAFDLSESGKEKALALAQDFNVEIDYRVENLIHIDYEADSFDAMALIYAHFPPQLRQKFHRKLSTYLKPGGIIILEGFSKNNHSIKKAKGVNNGPSNIEMLYTINMIKEDFPGFEIIALKEEIINLDEGKYHQGKASVIRFIGKKIA